MAIHFNTTFHYRNKYQGQKAMLIPGFFKGKYWVPGMDMFLCRDPISLILGTR